ncbi:glycosyltransferase 87 family protein [Streptomyces fragilis]|uniref:Glycosyltransferase 87 family protein n=1 Tax=Streptomyces fragilis TaxID=67301 RepID=A0ABV2YDU3_9ACTN|nr:glycosyltransferase 87 family protein [Streptomyces fragilis]
MLWLLTHDHLPWLGAGGVTHEPERLYTRWRETLDDGSYPSGDPLWQYPPGAGAALLLPGLLLPRLPYPWAFTALTLVADAAVTAALLRAGVTRRTRGGGRRSLLGALLWTAGLPLLLHVPLARFDVQVTALAVLALLVVDRLPRLGGALAALGALAKAWPALVLAGTEPGRTTRRAWASAALTAVTLLALLTSLFADALSFVRQQSGRGVQIESLGGTLLSFASRAGWPGQVRYQYGAMELVGPGVRVVAAASLALTAASFALIVLWRLRVVRATRAGSPHGHRYPALTHDAPLAAVLLLTVTSRVISPQYMIWLLGLSAVCLTLRHSAQRPVALLVVAATAVSALAYPVLYEEVVARTWTGCLVMAVRNGLLVAAAVLSCVRLARLTPGRDDGPDGRSGQAARGGQAPATTPHGPPPG